MITNDTIVDILLVEDNPNDAELALHVLKQHNLANRVEWVMDGEVALDFLFQRGTYANRPSTLPKVDGIEVLRQMRANLATKALPVVVLTSSKEERDVMETYKLGVNSYVAKPVAFDEFARTVAELGMYWVLVNRVPPGIRNAA